MTPREKQAAVMDVAAMLRDLAMRSRTSAVWHRWHGYHQHAEALEREAAACESAADRFGSLSPEPQP